MGLEQVFSLASNTLFSVSCRIGQLRSLLGQVMGIDKSDRMVL
ncbi:hypothetical protein [Nostoc sp.]